MITKYVEEQSKKFEKFLTNNEANQHYINSYLALIQWEAITDKKIYKKVLTNAYNLFSKKDVDFILFLEMSHRTKRLSSLLIEEYYKQ